MTNNDAFYTDLTAAEALEIVVSGQIPNPDPVPGSPEFEVQIIAKCLELAVGDAPDKRQIAQNILRTVRRHFVNGITTSQISIVSKDIIALLPKTESSSESEIKKWIYASVQLSAALLSLMKRHEFLENFQQALADMSEIWGSSDALASLCLALSPTDSPMLREQRQSVTGADALPVPKTSTFLFDWLISGFESTPDHFEQSPDQCTLADVFNQDPMLIPQNIRTLLKSPANWLREQYSSMNSLARHSVWLTLSGQRNYMNLPQISEDQFESWLHHEARQIESFGAWLSGHSAPSSNDSFECCLSALRRRENGDSDWYSGWLRNINFDFPPVCPFEGKSSQNAWNAFVIFWRALAWHEAGSTHRAIELLHTALTSESGTGQHWILLARLCAENKAFGESEHALQMAEESIPCALYLFREDETHRRMSASYWHQIVTQTGCFLAQKALAEALCAPEPNLPLLELAMRHGNAAIIAEAALCIFDCGSKSIAGVVDALAASPEGRACFIEKISNRHDTGRLDDLYELYTEIQNRLPQSGDMLLFRSLCQIDNPCMATQTLSEALTNLHPETELYWSAAELWIILKCEQHEYDQAILGIIQSLALDHPRATRTLMLIIAGIPREAYGMLQNIMIENLGTEQTSQILARVRKGIISQPESPEASISDDEIALTILPLTWQALYRASRLKPKTSPEDQNRAARVQSVLQSRSRAQAQSQAPEPAQWIHRAQQRASDEFDI
ncbi:MAG: hypothetical protein IJM59_06895 [Proteobacteria bacterium]|nr:hypothetical protein [Pseudomonadota bacterium]